MEQDGPLVAQPLYRRAEAAMVARIVGNVWTPGMRLPNEFALAREFGVSQGTIRKALMALEERGLLARSPGRGTTVARTTPAEALFAFFRLRDGEGRMATPEPVEEHISRRAATDAERAELGADCAEVCVLERVRGHAGAPLALERMRLPAHLTPGMERETPLPNSLYPYLQDRFGLAIMRATEAVTAVLADAATARRLGVAEGAPLLRVERRAFDLADRLVELRESFYRTDSAHYAVDLARTPPGAATAPLQSR